MRAEMVEREQRHDAVLARRAGAVVGVLWIRLAGRQRRGLPPLRLQLLTPADEVRPPTAASVQLEVPHTRQRRVCDHLSSARTRPAARPAPSRGIHQPSVSLQDVALAHPLCPLRGVKAKIIDARAGMVAKASEGVRGHGHGVHLRRWELAVTSGGAQRPTVNSATSK